MYSWLYDRLNSVHDRLDSVHGTFVIIFVKMIVRGKTALLAMAGVTVAIFTSVFLAVQMLHVTTSDETKQLQLVHVVIRHGARTPVSTYPNDPYINATLFPIGWGQLTNEGKLSLFNIGKFLRERYGSFLGTYYSPDKFYTQSTDTDRTKASMQLVNAGLWPPESVQKWGPIDWQPIPVQSEPLDQDMLLLVRQPCAQYHIERDRIMKSEEVQKLFQEYEPLFREITEITGQNVSDFDDIQDVFSTIQAEESFNLILPEWTKSYYPDKMLRPTILSYVLNAYNDKMNRLKRGTILFFPFILGVLLKKIITDWTDKTNGTLSPTDRQAFLYGGHDSTISNLMRTLKVWDPQLPVYGITVLLELYKDLTTDAYGVEIYLRNNTEVPPYKMTIPGCDSFCPLEKLLELTKNVIPENWEEECKTDDATYAVPDLGRP
ncbi:hypothetical protein NQ317_018215 [Molorchus minor]|uniref:Prostatic acid phosphatase n=1 Tax=Molorchus minor TaxID=1323400 RepID=A0ABQ9K3K0_9CUCU|nr:hypothetical protein NQ317_018215 [Molorchus minor]